MSVMIIFYSCRKVGAFRILAGPRMVSSKTPGTNEERQSGAGAPARTVVFLMLAANLLFAHGCHDDGDHELFAPTASATYDLQGEAQ